MGEGKTPFGRIRAGNGKELMYRRKLTRFEVEKSLKNE